MSQQSELYSDDADDEDCAGASPEFDFLSCPVCDCSLGAWEYEWCILSRLAQWLKIFINGDKRVGFTQN